jgi:putative oxidoreductase
MNSRTSSGESSADSRDALYRDAGWFVFRACYGLFFVPHGAQKLFGWFGGNIASVAQAVESIGLSPGMAWAYFIGGLELIGGLLLALGLFTRPVAVLFAGFMFVAAFFYNNQFGYFWPRGGMEVPLLLLALALALALRGGGEFSLDRRLGFRF